jgi:hypothetical protein
MYLKREALAGGDGEFAPRILEAALADGDDVIRRGHAREEELAGGVGLCAREFGPARREEYDGGPGDGGPQRVEHRPREPAGRLGRGAPQRGRGRRRGEQ